jgi:selenium donor protein
MEDAALLRPESGPRLAFTVDFITPIVDDPETYGAIAAANSLSDVYAMGGDPQIALAICGFPDDLLPLDVLARILRGGRDKAAEAGCAIVGGHTVLDPELKYGLCVIGSVPPDRALSQNHGQPGDRLVLTKPLGFGIAAQAIKNQALSAAELETAVEAMSALNKGAKDAALEAGANAATDVTGFGLLGHLMNVAAASKLSAQITASDVPALGFARRLAEAGVVPGGSKRNLAYIEPHTRFAPDVSPTDRLILADAQTSGGLLISVPAEREAQLCDALDRNGTLVQAVIGELTSGEPGTLRVDR